jgi:NAD(P)-dependent dehydrogenase (short-subunit alcohol dehydrogenase family)
VSRTILVTGGASGIGRAVVDAVIAAGWRAAVLDLPGDDLAALRAAHDDESLRVDAVDVTDEAAVAATVAAIAADGPRLGGVVTCAGFGRDVAALATTTGDFRAMFEVNVLGTFTIAREAARAMRDSGGGAIVTISSVSGLRGNEGRAAYGATKGAVIAMSLVLAVEFAPLGIRVNVIAPGPIETPLVARVHTPEVRRTWHASVPMRRYGAPADIAEAALFLLDDARSGYITGQTLAVDGGFVGAGMLSGTAEAANRDAR